MGFFHGIAIAAALAAAPGAGITAAAQHAIGAAQVPQQVGGPCVVGGLGLVVNCAEEETGEETGEGTGAVTEEGDEGLTLTTDEEAMLALMDPEDRARYLLQKRVQESAELGALLGQLQDLRHQTALQIIGNLR